MNVFEFLLYILPKLITGLRVTLELYSLTIIIGTPLGLIVGLARIYGGNFIYILSTLYVEFFRGTPLIVQIFMAYYGLREFGIILPAFWAATAAFALNTASYQAEYFRGAIQTVESGQIEAAQAIGMGRLRIILYVVLPQALRIVIPSWSNEAILMLKFTSLASVVAIPELMTQGKIIGARYFRYLETFVFIAIIYIIFVFLAAYLLEKLENKLWIPGLGTKEHSLL